MNLNHKWRMILLVHVVFFALWGAWLVRTQNSGEVIWLETAPVDPRDILSGNYVALTYVIQRPTGMNCAMYLGDNVTREMYVHLVPGTRQVMTPTGMVTVSEANECLTHLPADEQGIWAKAAIAGDRWGGPVRQVTYGIEKFFVNEFSSLRNVASGQVVAKVRANKNGQLHIIELVMKLPQPVPAVPVVP